jgi:HEAT repeat protein
MVFEVYVAGPLNKSHERIQMNEIVYRLHAIFGPMKEVVRLVIDIGTNRRNGINRQIDGLLVMKNQLVVLEIKSLSGKTITVDFDPELYDSAQETGDWREYRQRQKKWLVDGVPLEDRDDNPLDQVRDQRSNLNWFIRNNTRSNTREKIEGTERRGTDRLDSSRRGKEESPVFRLGKLISGFVVINKGEIVYANPIVEGYVKSQRWLAIFQMDDFAHRVQSEALTPSYGDPVLTEEEFGKLVELVGAEKRQYYRWLTKPLEHEYTEISRVPYLDFLFDSENPKNLIRAMEGAYQFRLRAYSEDIIDMYYRIEDEQVKIEALTILADWDISSLGDLFLYALERGGFKSLRISAIRYLQAENVYPQTLPSLESLLISTFESKENRGLTLMIIDAIGNLRSQDAGEVLFSFLDRLVGEDFYSRIITMAENDDPEGQTRNQLEIFSKTLEKINLCRYTKATGLVQRLLAEFPLAQYVSYSKMMNDRKHREDFLKNMRIRSALDTVLRGLVASVGDIWDGRKETEIVRIADDLFQETLSEGDKGFGFRSLYDLYLKALSRIGGKESLSALERHYDSLLLERIVSGEERLFLAESIIEAIGNMGLSKGYDFLAEKLQEYKTDVKLYKYFIVTILESLGSGGDPRYIKAISTLLELKEASAEDSQYVKHNAARALARIGGEQSFEVLLQVFLREPAITFDALQKVLRDSDTESKGKMAKRAEEQFLQKFKDETLLPGSRESYILEEVASEESLPFLFELAKDPEWYHRPLPQQIGRFSHIDWVQRKLVDMLESSEEDQRAFAVGVIAGTGCLGEETDNVLSRFKSDPSGLVRCSMIDYYSIVKKDCLEVSSFLNDPDMEVRVCASHGLQMTTHRGGQRCLAVSNQGWQGVQRMIYNEKGIFFLETSIDDNFRPEIDEDFESYEPFFLTASDIRRIFVHPARLKKGESEEIDILALYLEEEEQDGLRLLVLPLPEDDVLGVRAWRHFETGLDLLVSMYEEKQTGDELELKKADEMLRLAHDGYILSSGDA